MAKGKAPPSAEQAVKDAMFGMKNKSGGKAKELAKQLMKSKFSHDLNIERKTDKKDIYQDTRAADEESKREETSEDWDEAKLRSVVLSKKGNQVTTTDKVCKYFITAIEDGKYGWFWVCPNGGDKCKYKHALPPGYVEPCLPFHNTHRRRLLINPYHL